MSSVQQQSFSTSDLRAAAQDNKRDATHKHKWALGTVECVGRGVGNPRPHRPSETKYNAKRRETKGAVASLAHGTKMARKYDMLEGLASTGLSDDSASSNSDAEDRCFSTYADAVNPQQPGREPSHGSQILNDAMAMAVEKFESRETAKLIKTEYEVLDSDGESVALSPLKNGRGRRGKKGGAVLVDEEEDYEFV